VASKLQIAVFHVEAGLRSFDRTMPEEINRVLTDAISDLLFVSEPSGLENLKSEGVPPEKIHFVGNVMIDTLEKNRAKAEKSDILNKLSLSPKGFCVVTMHRPASVDHPEVMSQLADVFAEIQGDQPIVFPIHPRTRARLADADLLDRFEAMPNLKLLEPVGYLDFLKLMANASMVLTDSGGIQEETTILGVPCLTLRDNTERPVTLTEGTNQLLGMNPAKILPAYKALRRGQAASAKRPDKWDGRAAERIAAILAEWKRP
jgi:UDP-N-acetylglucosamine 2-epimerase (non-hydrolysing)